MTDEESKKLLAMLFAAFPVETRNVTPEEARATARVYARGLADLDSATAAKAIDRLIMSSERLPVIAKIRAMCVEIAHGRKRAGGDAWGDVVAAIRRVGGHRPAPAFDDPLVARAVAALGWRDLCLSENPVADRARFVQLYESLQDGERAEAQVSPRAESRLLRAANVVPISAALPMPEES